MGGLSRTTTRQVIETANLKWSHGRLWYGRCVPKPWKAGTTTCSVTFRSPRKLEEAIIRTTALRYYMGLLESVLHPLSDYGLCEIQWFAVSQRHHERTLNELLGPDFSYVREGTVGMTTYRVQRVVPRFRIKTPFNLERPYASPALFPELRTYTFPPKLFPAYSTPASLLIRGPQM